MITSYRSRILLAISIIGCFSLVSFDWGFYGHRQLNRMAVFTLPQEMLPIFKKHIEWITAHAVDPDKRRYAYAAEGPKHYIDLDSWGTFPFENIPRQWRDAKLSFTKLSIEKYNGEVVSYASINDTKEVYPKLFDTLAAHMPAVYFETEWSLYSLGELGIRKVVCQDTFYEEGVLPFQLVVLQSKLSNAFIQKDLDKILRYSADIGHYIGDAHVPLHTTKNYNGQLTDQIGIHAFWESRIPELFAESQYDNFVGRAEYIRDPSSFYWNIVLESHALVDSVLQIENRLKNTFPEDRQFCFDNRLQSTTRLECEEFAAAYQEALKGMVESRWRASILAIGSAWYTAWVDAGQPNLEGWRAGESSAEGEEEVDSKFTSGKILGRKH